MVGMLFNNLLYYYEDCVELSNILEFLLGNSFIATILLLICSYTFMFCKWHRLLIYGNFVNICIAYYDAIYHLPISDVELLSSYVIVDIIFILLIVYYKIKCKNKC